jgi:ammonium transporter, Amt family
MIRLRTLLLLTTAPCRASLVSGATIYKEKTWKFMLFIIFWTTFVYCPIAHWTWNPQGWGNKWGSLDFAGGTAVHITSGASALAWCLFFKFRLGRYNRSKHAEDFVSETDFTHHKGRKDIPTIVTGTVLLWIGWFGFNGGSALGANLRAVSACLSTHLSACAGGVMAVIHETAYEYLKAYTTGDEYQMPSDGERLRRLVLAWSNGAVVGLVSVTPAAGYVRISRSVPGLHHISANSFIDATLFRSIIRNHRRAFLILRSAMEQQIV